MTKFLITERLKTRLLSHVIFYNSITYYSYRNKKKIHCQIKIKNYHDIVMQDVKQYHVRNCYFTNDYFENFR